jgi:hypothetical protein
MNIRRKSVESTDAENDRTSLLNDSVNIQYQAIDGSLNTTPKTNNGVSWYFAVFLIVNSALGAGVLNFGKAFNEAGGITVSTVEQIVSCLVFLIASSSVFEFCYLFCIKDLSHTEFRLARYTGLLYGEKKRVELPRRRVFNVWQALANN